MKYKTLCYFTDFPEHCLNMIWVCGVEVLVAQSCLTLCDPMDCSPPGSSVHGILQARMLEGVAIPFSRGSSPPRDWTQVSHIAGRFFTIWTNELIDNCKRLYSEIGQWGLGWQVLCGPWRRCLPWGFLACPVMTPKEPRPAAGTRDVTPEGAINICSDAFCVDI